MQESAAVRNSDPEGEIDGRLVRHLDSLNWHQFGSSRWACAFASRQGTRKLSLHVAQAGTDPLMVPPQAASETILHVLTGQGVASIGGRDFQVSSGDGVFVKMGESLSLKSDGDQPLSLLMAICPGVDNPWVGKQTETLTASGFDEDYPERVVSGKTAKKESTGDRYFKILVGPEIGSTAVTQFIGSIPRSRAPEHFHLYEEVIFVLSGEGRIRIGKTSVPVRPGSLIFLPRKQPHCMECTVDEGIELLGMFYPAGSPAVNYKTQNEEE